MEKVFSLKRTDYIYLKNTMRCVIVLSLGFILSILAYHHSFASDVGIWDIDTNSWSTTFTDGDPIDLGTTNSAGLQQTAIDANGIVYIAYKQSDGLNHHLYLSRYDGTNVSIWDNDTANWTTTLANGDPIDTGTANNIDDPQIAIDSGGTVYVTYAQNNGASRGLYLSRYDGTNVSIWDHDTTSWTTTFADGDSIGSPNYTNMPQIAVDSNDIVYVTSLQNSHVYLNRYDGTEVSIWDHDTGSWTTTLADGDPIDTGGTNHSGAPIQMVVDPYNRVYITYEHYNGINWGIYLSHYAGTTVSIWDNDTANWTTTMADGDPIDTNTANDASNPSIAVGNDGTVYISYNQADGADAHVYLSRYDGSEISIWDNDTANWTTTLSDGDPVDTGTSHLAIASELAIDQNGILYVVHHQEDGANYHIYLSRYDGMEVSIWDSDTVGWTTTLANGDPIDVNNGNNAFFPQLAIDSDGKVFISYYSRKVENEIYINRYDGSELSIWDNDTASWTTSLADGDPINTNTAGWPTSPNLAISHDGTVYFTYARFDGGSGHVFMSRCLNTISQPNLSTPNDSDPVLSGGSGGSGGCFFNTILD